MENKMKVLMTGFLIIILVISPCQGSYFFHLNSLSHHKVKDIPESIIPKDDAFHGIQEQLTNEWWYFDAVFENGYGIHVGIKVISFAGRWGVVNQIINVYNHSIIEYQVSNMDLIDKFTISQNHPRVSYQGKPLLIFDYDEYNQTGNWNYLINVQVENIRVNLTFIQRTQGFKYVTAHEGWTVAQPKAIVNGVLTIDNRIIPVQGKGYHDHNWNFSLSTGLRSKGWYWGKVSSSNYTLTWAKILKMPFVTEEIVENIAIFNTIDEGFVHIEPENMKFSIDEKIFLNGRFIPTDFGLIINQDDFELNVTFHAVSIQKAPPDFLTIHYWRYFVSVSGYIEKDGKRDYLDNDLHIIEHVRFI